MASKPPLLTLLISTSNSSTTSLVRANANATSHQARMPRMDQCTMTARTSMGGTFSYMSRLTSGAGDFGDGDSQDRTTWTKEGCMMAWVIGGAGWGGGRRGGGGGGV